MADEQLMSVEFNLFFDEDGNLGPGGGLHLKVTNIGRFDERTLADTLSTGFKAVKAVREVAEVTKMDEARPQEPPPAERQRPAPEPPTEPAQPGGRPPGGASDAQCRMILALSHRLDDNIVIKAIEGYAGAEWRLDTDGHCLPNWDFLQSLDKFKASKIIEKLERAES